MPLPTHATVSQEEPTRLQLNLPESAVKFIKTEAIKHNCSPAEYVVSLLEQKTAYKPPSESPASKGKS